jgi:hypothetical protein
MPKDGELVIVKEVNSALIGTNLEEVLRGHFVGRSGKLYTAGLSMYTSSSNLNVSQKNETLVFDSFS